MDILVYSAVFVVGAAYILWPVFARARAAPVWPRESSLEWDALLAKKESAFDAITDIDFEYETGKLSDADYAQLRSSYRSHALDIMGRIDAFGADAGRVSNHVTEQAGAAPPRCPDCGFLSSDSDRFCSVCGSQLVHDGLCESCRSPLDPDDHFCGACGFARSPEGQAPAPTAASNPKEILP